MAYDAYETASNAALNMLQALERHLTTSGSFDTNSHPTLTQVETFLTTTYEEINARLEGYGYQTGQTDANVIAILQRYNVWGAAALCEMAQPVWGYSEETNARADRFTEMYEKVDERIASDAFAQLGATKSKELSLGLSYGGVSISDKETIEGDTDFEPYAFHRDLHKVPGQSSSYEDRTSLT